MSIPTTGWKNKNGTANRSCNCGTWKQHWVRFSKKAWPTTCSVQGCFTMASLGAHVINSSVAGERIVPMCNSCNGLNSAFSLKGGVSVPSANTSGTCG